jgi:hypothetical protein
MYATMLGRIKSKGKIIQNIVIPENFLFALLLREKRFVRNRGGLSTNAIRGERLTGFRLSPE